MKDSSMLTIGIDLGDKHSDVCVLDGEGNVVERKQVATSKGALTKWLGTRPESVVIIEVSAHSRWVSKLVEGCGHTCIVANPQQVALIYAHHKKSDLTDPERLARLGRVDPTLLSPIQHRGEEVHGVLTILQGRRALVECRTKLVNLFRGQLKCRGIKVPACAANSFHKKVQEVLPDELRVILWPMVDMIAELTKRIREYEKRLEALAKESYPEHERLTQVDGVGLLTSLTFIALIEDPRRFKTSRDIGAYFGLVPKRHQSCSKDPELRITKRGNGEARVLLVQCAQYILGPFGKDSDLRRWGLELASRGGKNAKKRAIIAVARKLAVLLHRLWVSGETYMPLGYASERKSKMRRAA